jgi:hypothetical protein
LENISKHDISIENANDCSVEDGKLDGLTLTSEELVSLNIMPNSSENPTATLIVDGKFFHSIKLPENLPSKSNLTIAPTKISMDTVPLNTEVSAAINITSPIKLCQKSLIVMAASPHLKMDFCDFKGSMHFWSTNCFDILFLLSIYENA